MAMINYADKVALNTNDSIADINKVNATDMNDIKNAINQEGAYSTATAVTNGDFKTTLVGTLDTNDIIIVSFPNATNGTSNARISIDNGVTYKNILDFVGTNVVASNIQASKRRLLYNGTSFVLDDVDYGSNSNGNYTRYKDGTMIQRGTGSCPSGIGYANITFPVAFFDSDYIIIANHKYAGGSGYGGSGQLRNITSPQSNNASTAFIYSYLYDGTIASYIRNVQYVAYGRWK